MYKSPVYHAMTLPKLLWGLPLTYAALMFGVSLIMGGVFGFVVFKQPIVVLFVAAPVALVFWVIGFFMTKKDPEFLDVWIKSCFSLGGKNSPIVYNGKRDYEP